LDVINRLEKHEQIVNISHNVRFVHISTSTICDDDTDRNTESAMLGKKPNLILDVSYIFIALEINEDIV
jgi:hypothetical protein